jgi:hypothetical protein
LTGIIQLRRVSVRRLIVWGEIISSFERKFEGGEQEEISSRWVIDINQG